MDLHEQHPSKKQKPNPENRNVTEMWKVARQKAPVMYDFLHTDRSEYPSWDCIWIDGRGSKEHYQGRILYSRSTDAAYDKSKHIWKGDPHALEVMKVNIPKPLMFPTEQLSEMSPEHSSKDICRVKRIIHPGPVTRIKSMPQFPSTIATHTRHKYTFLWNTDTQTDRSALMRNSDPNTPQLILKGHRDNATRALDFNVHCHFVCSGGSDKRVCVWGIDDYETSLSQSNNSDSDPAKLQPAPKLRPACVFRGHEETVSEVLFHPDNMTSLCSTSESGNLLYWDIRSGAKHTGRIDGLHEPGPTSLAWNPHRADAYVITGGHDGKIKLVDVRMLRPLETFHEHSGPVTQLQWGPTEQHFISSSADQTAIIWDFRPNATKVYFRHWLHTGPVQSVSWSACGNKWNIISTASVPDPDTQSTRGELHIWRPAALLTHPKETLKKLNYEH